MATQSNERRSKWVRIEAVYPTPRLDESDKSSGVACGRGDLRAGAAKMIPMFALANTVLRAVQAALAPLEPAPAPALAAPGPATAPPVDTLDAPSLPPAPSLATLGVRLPPPGSQPASAFFAALGETREDAREDAIEATLSSGNFPSALRDLVPVVLKQKLHGKQYTVVVYVMPDHLAVGTDADHVRMPMWSSTAQRLADAWNLRLPTAKLVDAITKQADARVPFAKRDPGPAMESNAWFQAHDREIDAHVPVGARLIAGGKKDTVLSNKRQPAPNQVVIYGAAFADGRRVQPLHTGHFHRFSDYSQGIRFVAPKVAVQVETPSGRSAWQWRDYDEVLADLRSSALLSDEGPIKAPMNRYPTDRWAGTVHAKR